MSNLIGQFSTTNFAGARIIGITFLFDDCSSEVCPDEVSAEMSSETLERILNVTLSEPMLDGVLPLPSSTCQSTQINTSGPSSLSPYSPATNDCSTGPTSDSSAKRPKLDNSSTTQTELFTSEQDIDSFLDQIHQ